MNIYEYPPGCTYAHFSYQDPTNQDPLSLNSESVARPASASAAESPPPPCRRPAWSPPRWSAAAAAPKHIIQYDIM